MRTPGERRRQSIRRTRSVAGDRLRSSRKGFTLIELLVVLLIILLVSAVTLPTILPALNHRQLSEAARILQAALVGARDQAIHDGQPSGIRLLPDPNYPIQWVNQGQAYAVNPTNVLAYNRVIPISPAPDYSEGYCTPFQPSAMQYLPGSTATFQIVPPSDGSFTLSSQTPGMYVNALILVESPLAPAPITGNPPIPNSPTSWYWNVRVGDKIQLQSTGPYYTVVGPMIIGPSSAIYNGVTYANPELYVNVGPPDILANQATHVPTVSYTYNTGTGPTTVNQYAEFLVLVNGQDDNNNGWIDEGFDGIDNDGDGYTDEYTCNLAPAWGETESEEWLGAVPSAMVNVGGSPASNLGNIPYTIQRNPGPMPNAREIAIPASIVIDATTSLPAPFATSISANMPFPDKERSRLPVNPYNGYVDIIINPDGSVLPTTSFSSPSLFRMDQAYYHFWLAERQDVYAVNADANGNPQPWASGAPYYLPIAPPSGTYSGQYPGPYLQGEYSVLTLFNRTGQIAVNSNPQFLNGSGTYNASYPFIPAEQGSNGGP